MSMNATFRHVSPLGLAALRRDPGLVERIVDSGPAAPLQALHNASPGAVSGVGAIMDGLRSRLSTLPREQQAAARKMLDDWTSRNDQVLGRVAAGAPVGAAAPALPFDLGDAPALDIEKAWHGLHFLLNGTADEAPGPLGMAVLGGREVGEDLGYGPLRTLDAGQAVQVAEALAGLDAASLAPRLDARALDAAGIYPGGWDDPESAEWLVDAFTSVRDFYSEAATAGHAMLLYLL